MTNSLTQQTELLTLPDAAKLLAISKRTLMRLVAAGKFPRPVKIGRISRVPVEDIQSFKSKLMQARQLTE